MRPPLSKKEQALFAAIEKRDVKAVRNGLREREFLLFRAINPNILNEEGFSPLHKAVLAENSAIIDLLVRAGAVIDTDLECKHVRSTGYHDGQPGVRFGRGRTDHHHALNDGSDDYKSSCFSHAHYVLQQEQLRYYRRALKTKISNNDLKSLETLIAAGAKVHYPDSNDSPLFYAITLGNIEATRSLLQAAGSNIADERFTSGKHKGLTLLEAAAKYIKEIDFTPLNKQRVSDIKNTLALLYPRTKIGMATSTSDIYQLLEDYPDQPERVFQFFEAMQAGNISLLREMLRLGFVNNIFSSTPRIDIHRDAFCGMALLDVAKELGNPEVIKLLQEASTTTGLQKSCAAEAKADTLTAERVAYV